MPQLNDWIGKTEDFTLDYDVTFGKPLLLTEGDCVNIPNSFGEGVTVNKEVGKDLLETEWETSVSKADKLDYEIAIACGILAGLVDSFFVGKFSLENASEWGNETIDEFVKKIARNKTDYSGDDISEAIKHLEEKFGLAADSNTNQFGGGTQHHLRDFSHHFSIVGLLCSIFTQFTGKVIGTDTLGVLLIVPVNDYTLIGKNFQEKIAFGIINWFFHMVSDMAGSSGSRMMNKTGTGIPGPVVSLIKEMSALPFFRDMKMNGVGYEDVEFHTWVSKLFNGTLLAKRDDAGKIIEPRKFDLREEIGILHELGRQLIPVVINECAVRGAYFIRRLYWELKNNEIHCIKDLVKIDAGVVLPFNNRALTRMLTVATGTFTVIDFTDAGVRALIENGGVVAGNPKFLYDFVVRINIVGVGRFAVACVVDGKQVYEDAKLEKEKQENESKEYEKAIAEINCLALNYEQLRILYSLERLQLKYDVLTETKSKEEQYKKQWLEKWSAATLESLPLNAEGRESFFLNESELYNEIESEIIKSDGKSWLDLIALETRMFKAYHPLGEEDDDKYKRLKLENYYLLDRFCDGQQHVSKSDIEAMRKSFKVYESALTGGNKKLIGIAGTAVAVVAAGGITFILAPELAPIIASVLFEDALAGLSGAALTSASLALLGGGALTAGGFGMAGGTAVLVGGGALIAGAASKTTLSMYSAINLLSNDSYVFDECLKLLTFSNILSYKYHDKAPITGFINRLELRTKEIEGMKHYCETSGVKSKTTKNKIKVLNNSLKYLERCREELEEML